MQHHAGVAQDGRAAFLDRFRWDGGHADVWRAFEDGPALRLVVESLAEPWLDAGITRVAGVEARGFLLGGAVAVRLGAGFQAVRKAGAIFPGPKQTVTSAPDYRGSRHELSLQDTLTAGDVVLLVDDWAERGSQALAVKALVERRGAAFAGVSLVVDQLDAVTRTALGRVTSLVTADELGAPDA